MKYLDGDLIRFARAGKFQVIVHGCNCFNTMGGGIARQVRMECPEAWQKDQQTIQGDKNKLGTITYALIEPKDARNSEFYCVNGYTQYDFGSDKVNVDYNAVRSVMKKVCSLFPDKKIGLPLIGAGLAGGDWNIIEQIIKEELEDKDVDITIVIFRQ
jgi:O-acetyl-ADP-ribose deacetylase (regulator of RNase III)